MMHTILKVFRLHVCFVRYYGLFILQQTADISEMNICKWKQIRKM